MLLVCRVGCRASDITAALGLSLRDLFADARRSKALEPEAPLAQARRLVQADARRSGWARDGALDAYHASDWVRKERRVIATMRELVASCPTGEACEACWMLRARAAARETRVLNMESALEAP